MSPSTRLPAHLNPPTASSFCLQALERAYDLLLQVVVDVETIKIDGIFSFDRGSDLVDVEESQKLHFWRLYYSLAKVYLELEVLSVLIKGAFLLAPPRVSLRGYVGRADSWWWDESPVAPRSLME